MNETLVLKYILEHDSCHLEKLLNETTDLSILIQGKPLLQWCVEECVKEYTIYDEDGDAVYRTKLAYDVNRTVINEIEESVSTKCSDSTQPVTLDGCISNEPFQPDCLNVLKLLLECGMTPLVLFCGVSVLEYACLRGSPEVVDLILSHTPQTHITSTAALIGTRGHPVFVSVYLRYSCECVHDVVESLWKTCRHLGNTALSPSYSRGQCDTDLPSTWMQSLCVAEGELCALTEYEQSLCRHTDLTVSHYTRIASSLVTPSRVDLWTLLQSPDSDTVGRLVSTALLLAHTHTAPDTHPPSLSRAMTARLSAGSPMCLRSTCLALADLGRVDVIIALTSLSWLIHSHTHSDTANTHTCGSDKCVCAVWRLMDAMGVCAREVVARTVHFSRPRATAMMLAWGALSRSHENCGSGSMMTNMTAHVTASVNLRASLDFNASPLIHTAFASSSRYESSEADSCIVSVAEERDKSTLFIGDSLIEMMVRAGVDVNVCIADSGANVLHVACFNNNHCLVKRICELTLFTPSTPSTPHIPVNTLLTLLCARDSAGHSPLHVAASVGASACFDELLQWLHSFDALNCVNGANTGVDVDGVINRHVCDVVSDYCSRNGNQDINSYINLLSHKISNIHTYTNGSRSDEISSTGLRALREYTYTSLTSDIPSLSHTHSLLLTHALLSSRDYRGRSPVQLVSASHRVALAVRDSDLVSAANLLKDGAPVDTVEPHGMSLLWLAVCSGVEPMVGLVMQYLRVSPLGYMYYLSSPLNTQDDDGRSLLFASVSHATSATTRLLVSEGVDVNHRDNKGHTAVFESARYCSDVTVLHVDEMTQNGMQTLLFDRDPVGRTTLMTAAVNGNYVLVKYLLEQGVSVSIRDLDGLSALDYAIMTESELIDNLHTNKHVSQLEQDMHAIYQRNKNSLERVQKTIDVLKQALHMCRI